MTTTTTKTCSKCNENKPVTQFTRRGSNPGSYCKSCMRSYAKSHQSVARKISPITTIDPVVAKRIADLDNRIQLIARSFSNGDPMAADDCYGFVVEKLLTSVKGADSTGRILMIAKSRAKDWLAAANTYSAYVGSEPQAIDEDGDEVGGFEFYNPEPDRLRTVEDEVADRMALEAIISSLPAENRKVVTMLAIGYKQKEIAQELGITEQAVGQRISSLAKNQVVLRLQAA